MGGASGAFTGRRAAGAIVVLVLAAFAVAVGVSVLRSTGGDAEVVPAARTTSAAPVPASVYVHVAGAVGAPGLYSLPARARVADAIAAAGGFTPDADRGAVNLARLVQDGEQVAVPVMGAPPPAGPAPGADALVDLNSADAAALEMLPGIGPALAARILAWREENGRFAAVDDLLDVPGIGEKLLAGLREAVRV